MQRRRGRGRDEVGHGLPSGHRGYQVMGGLLQHAGHRHGGGVDDVGFERCLGADHVELSTESNPGLRVGQRTRVQRKPEQQAVGTRPGVGTGPFAAGGQIVEVVVACGSTRRQWVSIGQRDSDDRGGTNQSGAGLPLETREPHRRRRGADKAGGGVGQRRARRIEVADKWGERGGEHAATCGPQSETAGLCIPGKDIQQFLVGVRACPADVRHCPRRPGGGGGQPFRSKSAQHSDERRVGRSVGAAWPPPRQADRRQQAVRLPAHPKRRQRPEPADMVDEQFPRGVDGRIVDSGGQQGLSEISSGGRPQRGVHRTGIRGISSRRALDALQRADVDAERVRGDLSGRPWRCRLPVRVEKLTGIGEPGERAAPPVAVVGGRSDR